MEARASAWAKAVEKLHARQAVITERARASKRQEKTASRRNVVVRQHARLNESEIRRSGQKKPRPS